MTPSQLKSNYLKHNPNGLWFSRANMRFLGDTMRNFGCYDGGDVWVLWRKRPVKDCGYQASTFFCKHTFRPLHRIK